jgi:hypothetical protein
VIIPDCGAVGQVNLRLPVAGRFFEAHKELTPWMLPQFFEVWDDGKPALKQHLVTYLGEATQGTVGSVKERMRVLITMNVAGGCQAWSQTRRGLS